MGSGFLPPTYREKGKHMERTIDDYHATRESGSGCPETDGGAHYFAFLDEVFNGRICIDCGEPEPER